MPPHPSFLPRHIDDKVALTADQHIRDGWHVTHRSDSPPARAAAPPASSGDTGAPTAVVDLRLNPERHTGYAGESAAMVWKAIHESNCFQGLDPDGGGGVGKMKMPHSYMVGTLGADPSCLLPAEQRVYNRLISGMHTSISLHIAKHFCHQLSDVPGECESWGEAPAIAADRVMSHPDREMPGNRVYTASYAPSPLLSTGYIIRSRAGYIHIHIHIQLGSYLGCI